MPATALIKPTHKAIKQYPSGVERLPGTTRHSRRRSGNRVSAPPGGHGQVAPLHAYPQAENPRRQKQHLPDGTVRDTLYDTRLGFWEAKDTDDDLDKEIAAKIAKGYPLNNTIFEDTRRAVLFQGGNSATASTSPTKAKSLPCSTMFYAYTEPEIENFQQASGRIQGPRSGIGQGTRSAKLDEATRATRIPAGL